jgi:hypothetical protein
VLNTGGEWDSFRKSLLEVAAGFEIRTIGAHELTLVLVQLCPTIRAGAFDQFEF